MTQEEKAKRYDEAIKRAKELLEIGVKDTRDKMVVLSFFPELKESEDEKIRKEIINYLSTVDDKELIPYESWLAFLEKQGEQKSTDKVEPKFKVGDWIIDDNIKNPFLITDTSNGKYDVISTYGNDFVFSFNEVEHFYHLWTIQDAKDSDILCTYECDEPKIVFILKGTPKRHYALSYHCYYNIMYPHFDSDSEKGCLAPNDEDVKPATKEQRDLLFQKMKEAGHEWDAEKKELKKIEQNPGEWGEEDEKMFLDIESLIHSYRTGNYEHELSSWFESLKGRIVPQPKYKWSEKDNIMIENIIDTLKENIEEYGLTERKGYSEIDILDWINNRLKSLRPQSHWKPTEEQIRAIETVVKFVNNAPILAPLKELLEQLKTL